jgi:hypothetical protein
MSFLQIGQVRRRVVSHGVLEERLVLWLSAQVQEIERRENLHAGFVELVATGQAHHAADTIDILFQTDDAFTLFATVTTSPLCQTCCLLLFHWISALQ